MLDIIGVAAESPDDCEAAVAATGQSTRLLVDAARFYIQQVLFRGDADAYRILGLHRGASREQARKHMRGLMQWLHPDRRTDFDNVYAERVLKAWHEVSTALNASETGLQAEQPRSGRALQGSRRGRRGRRSGRSGRYLPWIELPPELAGRRQTKRRLVRLAMGVLAGLVFAGSLLHIATVRRAANDSAPSVASGDVTTRDARE